jgi:hypothetical protein
MSREQMADMSAVPSANTIAGGKSAARPADSRAPGDSPRPQGSRRRTLAAIFIGLAFAVALWIATPYNNYLLLNSAIADNYLPLGPIIVILLLVLGANPLLRSVRPALALTSGQLGIIFAIVLVAAVIPGFGLMRALPYMLAHNPQAVNQRNLLAEQYDKADLPDSMFPDKIRARGQTPAGDGFTGQLRPGEPMPWHAWLGPAVTWGVFLLFAWMMMVALGSILLPQWRDNERLAFPLLAVQQSLIESAGQAGSLPPIFRSRLFWVVAGAVFLVHLLSGANLYMPDTVPAVPLAWKAGNIFTGTPWGAFEASVRDQRIYFSFIGLAFFMPGRIAFSIWFFIVLYGFYRMIGYSYFPPFYDGQMYDQRTGAMIGLAVSVLWIGRAQWIRVARSLFRRCRTPEERRCRDHGWLLIAGLAGMVVWITLAGLPLGWAIVLVAFGFMCALLVSRMVAEAGMPLMRLHADGLYLAKLAPIKLLSPAVLFMAQAMTVLFPMTSRANAAAMAVQGEALAEENSPARPRRLTWLFLAVLVLGFLVSGSTHLWMNYHHDRALNDQPVNGWGLTLMDEGNRAIEELGRGNVGRPPQNSIAHITFGAVLAGLLYWLSMTFPTWPLHPIGLMMVQTVSHGNKVWASIFFGWLIKQLIVRFGGAMAYRRARAAFLGLILGEIFAAVFWALAQLVIIRQNVTFQMVEVLPM